ncbi:hypothetical protein DYB28_010076 [Aphanomyces astaci]|uniref:VASt domain-containing protein n=1 Tax=Aphanomyces astaci TaxID=112090 RepID=A0A9X8E2R1_APHAT|nr:hypothetical protein DYB28_010076 [Aphanomyces astaci]
MAYTAFSRPETFQSERRVTFVHNKKNFIGPSAIPTIQIYRYTYTPGQRLVVSVTSSVHDAPFCDYFRAESRWVFDASLSSAHECSLVSPVAAATSEDGRRMDQDAVAATMTMKLDPDTSLRLLRRLNVVGVVVLVVLLLQLMATLYNLRTTTNESVRLQNQHQVLLRGCSQTKATRLNCLTFQFAYDPSMSAYLIVCSAVLYTILVSTPLALAATAPSDVWKTNNNRVIVLHHRHGYMSTESNVITTEEHAALRRLIASIEAPSNDEASHRRAGIPAEYAVNLMQPFGGASASAEIAAHDKQKAEASSLDKAHSGTSAEKKADRGDIFYEKLIIFKTSHDRVKENAESDNKRLSSRDVSQQADRGQMAKQRQTVT